MKLFLKSVSLLILMAFSAFAGVPENWHNFPVSSKIYKARATNYLANPSFTGSAGSWTLSDSVYDPSRYQDSAGSLRTETVAGRNNAITGGSSQTLNTNIGSSDIVQLSLYWSKQCVSVTCAMNTISVDIAEPSAPNTWITIWSDASKPNAGNATGWTGPSSLDVSSYFTETGEYKIKLSADLKNGNDKSAQALAWLDNINLNVIPAVISISVSDGNVEYGIVAPNTNKNTNLSGINDSQKVINNGNVTENFNIKGQNSAGWTLAETVGNEQYTHKFCTSNCDTSPVWTALSTSYQTLVAGMNINGSQDFDLQIGTPTATVHYTLQNVSVTVQAVAP